MKNKEQSDAITSGHVGPKLTGFGAGPNKRPLWSVATKALLAKGQRVSGIPDTSSYQEIYVIRKPAKKVCSDWFPTGKIPDYIFALFRLLPRHCRCLYRFS